LAKKCPYISAPQLFPLNDVNKRLGSLIGWLFAEKLDVVALQELKAARRLSLCCHSIRQWRA